MVKGSDKIKTRLTEKLLMAAYKSKIVKFKLDDNPLQRRIYFLAFLESLKMIFSQYKETCEVLIYYSKIGREDIKELEKNSIKNILRANIDVHSRRLIREFTGDGIKCIEKLQSRCANMTFDDKSRYEIIFQQVTHKLGEYAMSYNKIFKNEQAL